MKTFLLCALGLIALSPSSAPAGTVSQETIIKVNDEVIVPRAFLRGDAKTVAAGQFVLELGDTYTSRNLVHIYNANRTRHLGQVLGIPTQRALPRYDDGRALMVFDQAYDGTLVLRKWYFAGDIYGLEFPGGVNLGKPDVKIQKELDESKAETLEATKTEPVDFHE